jgi:hypothetical protein
MKPETEKYGGNGGKFVNADRGQWMRKLEDETFRRSDDFLKREDRCERARAKRIKTWVGKDDR